MLEWQEVDLDERIWIMKDEKFDPILIIIN